MAGRQVLTDRSRQEAPVQPPLPRLRKIADVIEVEPRRADEAQLNDQADRDRASQPHRHGPQRLDARHAPLTRRGSSLGTYLDPHNGHLVLFPVLVYKLLFAIVGLRHYWPYRAATILLHLLSCGLLYALAGPRLGRWLALGPAALLLFMGSA